MNSFQVRFGLNLYPLKIWNRPQQRNLQGLSGGFGQRSPFSPRSTPWRWHRRARRKRPPAASLQLYGAAEQARCKETKETMTTFRRLKALNYTFFLQKRYKRVLLVNRKPLKISQPPTSKFNHTGSPLVGFLQVIPWQHLAAALGLQGNNDGALSMWKFVTYESHLPVKWGLSISSLPVAHT